MYTERKESPEVDGANNSNRDLEINEWSNNLGMRPPEIQPKSLPLPLSIDGIGGKGGGDDGLACKFGELIEAPKEASRRIPPATILGEPVLEGDGRLSSECVGVPGRDVLDLEGDSPAAASVSRNSTHRREND